MAETHTSALDLDRRLRPGETVIRGGLLLAALLSVAITVGIVVALVEPVLAFFGQVDVGDFFAVEGEFAVLPLVSGTLMVTLIALLVAVPLGLGAAMYLSEYASPRTRRALKLRLHAGLRSRRPDYRGNVSRVNQGVRSYHHRAGFQRDLKNVSCRCFCSRKGANASARPRVCYFE